MTPEEQRQRADQALRDGVITRTEHAAFIAYLDGMPRPARHRFKLIILALVIAVMLAGAWFLPGIMTGFVILEPSTPAGDVIMTINQTITGLNVTGTLQGEGNATITLDTTNGPLVVARITSDPGTLRTDKASYDPGDQVIVEHAPTNASYYFDDGTTNTPVAVPLNASTNGTLLIVTTTSTYRLPITIGNTIRTTTFNDHCEQTCTMTPTNGTLRITTTGSASITIARVDAATAAPNQPPVLAVPLPALLINDTTVLNLSRHVIDADSDPVYYTIGDSDLVSASINGDLLVLNPQDAGNGTITVYASDLHDTLVPITINITVIAPAMQQPNTTTSENGTLDNETLAPALLAQNTSIENTSGPATNATMPQNATATGIDCSNPNPNLRPLECLQAAPDRYFTEPSKYWENSHRERVARINALGNLVIKGTIHEHATGTPGASDFVLGTSDESGNLQPTIWVSTTTGDLYVTGALQEEVINMNPRPGMYSIVTRRSIYLLLADTSTGDVYLRGDLITGHEVNE